MIKKQLTVLVLLVFLLAMIPTVDAACPKNKTCTAAKPCGSCGDCKGLCITFLGCTGAEYIKISNCGTTVMSTAGYKIGLKKCTSCREYRYNLPAKTIKPNSCMRFFLKAGKSKCPQTAYMGLCKGNCNILSCSGQIVNLYDSEGKLVSSKSN